MRQKFVSPLPLFSRIQEEMRSYFASGSIDTLLFTIWTKDCIERFENTYIPIREVVMDLYNGKCELPCNFRSVREVWLCATIDKGPIRAPGQYYYQTDCRIQSHALDDNSSCDECVNDYQCNDIVQQPVSLPSLCDVPMQYRVTNMVQTYMNFSFTVSCLLKPGNFRTVGKCAQDCPNIDNYALDTFDIMDNKLLTSFGQGTVYMAYYADPMETPDHESADSGYYMIPDNKPFYDYLYHYLRFMIYQQLFDQSTDETFNQIKYKRDDAEMRMWDSFKVSRAYATSGDIYDVQKAIVRSYNRHNRYLLKGPATRR